ncbi:hypothetical protein BDDG_12356 [Blastomyces dermatitidis ATCC 18188]|uniref:Uncharacterized protein n=1 Tax=Ajellomyces dermatitidis (strain ATCC 18188 / CBS 674.68) TaxID=653446 RepID=A0A0J9EP57_AJEDA|nr:hypothetical protein BDDG_12356 [Blastomyces dermatitidis ATCC 18188]
MRSAMGSECSYDRGLFDGSIGGFLFEKSSEFVVERLEGVEVEDKEQKLAEKKRIKILFRSQMCFIIQNIEKTALLSEHVNLLTTEIKPETADQKMQDFEIQIDLTEREQQKPFSEKIVKRDFEIIIISDKKKKKKKK